MTFPMHRNGRFAVRRTPSETGDEYGRETFYIEKRHAVAGLVIHADKLLLVRQYRPMFGRQTLEIPAGGIRPSETPEQAMARELLEETGAVGLDLRLIWEGATQPSVSTERLHLFLATDVVLRQRPSVDDPCTPVWLPLSAVGEAINRREVEPVDGLLIQWALGLQVDWGGAGKSGGSVGSSEANLI